MIKHTKIGLHFAKGFESCWWRKSGSGDDLCPSPFLCKIFFLVLNRMPRQRVPNRTAVYPHFHNPGISNWDNKATQLKSSFPEAGKETRRHISITKGTCRFWHHSHGFSTQMDSSRARHLCSTEMRSAVPFVPSLWAWSRITGSYCSLAYFQPFWRQLPFCSRRSHDI